MKLKLSLIANILLIMALYAVCRAYDDLEAASIRDKHLLTEIYSSRGMRR